jgi:hypothetical protein
MVGLTDMAPGDAGGAAVAEWNILIPSEISSNPVAFKKNLISEVVKGLSHGHFQPYDQSMYAQKNMVPIWTAAKYHDEKSGLILGTSSVGLSTTTFFVLCLGKIEGNLRVEKQLLWVV